MLLHLSNHLCTINNDIQKTCSQVLYHVISQYVQNKINPSLICTQRKISVTFITATFETHLYDLILCSSLSTLTLSNNIHNCLNPYSWLFLFSVPFSPMKSEEHFRNRIRCFVHNNQFFSKSYKFQFKYDFLSSKHTHTSIVFICYVITFFPFATQLNL